MLLALREYIQKYQTVSLEQLKREFQSSESALEMMLEFWIQKGVIIALERESHCGQPCGTCKPPKIIFYEFQSKNKLFSS